MREIGQIIDDFNVEASKLHDKASLARLFSRVIKELGYGGFDAWCLYEGTINNPQQPGNFFVHDYNLNVLLEYILNSFLPTDPAMAKIGEKSSPIDIVKFLKSSNKNSAVKWQLRMLALFNVHHGWMIPTNIVGANRGVTCYMIGKSEEKRDHFLATRTSIQLISLQFMEHISRLYPRQLTPSQIGCGQSPELSARELDCLHWIAQGKTNGEIALLLEISENTVRFHLKNLFSKFHVNTRSNAVLCGIQFGLIEG